MIPLRDDNPAQRIPVVTRVFILANIAIWVVELSLGEALPEFLREWGVVPGRLVASLAGDTSLPVEAATLVTSMFLHGGWMHIIGNMWYLWIFGDNVEDRMGSLRYFFFYLVGGVVSALVHSALLPGSAIPTVGASGAIAAVLGGYAQAFPRARVLTLIPVFFFFQVIAVPALVLLGVWFLIQFVAGTLTFGSGSGGVAWWAHIAGFVYGFIAMALLTQKRRP